MDAAIILPHMDGACLQRSQLLSGLPTRYRKSPNTTRMYTTSYANLGESLLHQSRPRNAVRRNCGRREVWERITWHIQEPERDEALLPVLSRSAAAEQGERHIVTHPSIELT